MLLLVNRFKPAENAPGLSFYDVAAAVIQATNHIFDPPGIRGATSRM